LKKLESELDATRPAGIRLIMETALTPLAVDLSLRLTTTEKSVEADLRAAHNQVRETIRDYFETLETRADASINQIVGRALAVNLVDDIQIESATTTEQIGGSAVVTGTWSDEDTLLLAAVFGDVSVGERKLVVDRADAFVATRADARWMIVYADEDISVNSSREVELRWNEVTANTTGTSGDPKSPLLGVPNLVLTPHLGASRVKLLAFTELVKLEFIHIYYGFIHSSSPRFLKNDRPLILSHDTRAADCRMGRFCHIYDGCVSWRSRRQVNRGVRDPQGFPGA